jgi:lipooligosaccharide transport system ATP-binding protein
VDGIDFDVPAGVCFGFLGPNGAGKTTTMKMIYGLARVDAGELSVLGLDARRERREVKARIGVVPQEQNLDRELTVRENLAIQALYHGVSGDGRIEELLDFTLLAERADAKPVELSGGMKRRLLIARALVNEPELVVLDEPTTGLDPQARLAVWRLLERLRKEGVTLLITTHYMEEAERICDRLVIMDEGRIVSEGEPHELLERYGERNLEGVFLQVAGHELRE